MMDNFMKSYHLYLLKSMNYHFIYLLINWVLMSQKNALFKMDNFLVH